MAPPIGYVPRCFGRGGGGAMRSWAPPPFSSSLSAIMSYVFTKRSSRRSASVCPTDSARCHEGSSSRLLGAHRQECAALPAHRSDRDRLWTLAFDRLADWRNLRAAWDYCSRNGGHAPGPNGSRTPTSRRPSVTRCYGVSRRLWRPAATTRALSASNWSRSARALGPGRSSSRTSRIASWRGRLCRSCSRSWTEISIRIRTPAGANLIRACARW